MNKPTNKQLFEQKVREVMVEMGVLKEKPILKTSTKTINESRKTYNGDRFHKSLVSVGLSRDDADKVMELLETQYLFTFN